MTLLVLALAVCPGRALAASDVPLPGMDELTEALPEEAAPILSGVSPDERIVETVELKDHPFFIGVQFQPEFKSRPNRAHPLFKGFVAAALKNRK